MKTTLFSVLSVPAILLAVTSSAPAEKEEVKRYYSNRDGSCNVNGYIFQHDQVFTIPGFSQCLKYRCSNGGWDVAEEACDVHGQCHPVGSTFEQECITYRCDKSHKNGGSWYQPTIISTLCKDYYGRCHYPGRGTFPYALNGRLYDNCSCSTGANGYTHYSCRF